MQDKMADIGIIFDFDGVVVLSEPTHIRNWDDVAERFDLPLPENFGENGVGRSDRVLADELAGIWNGEVSPDAIVEAKRHFYRERGPVEIPLVEGSREALKHFSGQYPVALATSSSAHDIAPLFERHALDGFFDVRLTVESITRPKPDPEIYLKAAAALGLAPGDCWVFEDSRQGAQAARDAGARVIGLTTTYPAEELGALEASFADFGALPAMIELIASRSA